MHSRELEVTAIISAMFEIPYRAIRKNGKGSITITFWTAENRTRFLEKKQIDGIPIRTSYLDEQVRSQKSK
jgi:hypothetical protein